MIIHDIHTHNPQATEAIINIAPADAVTPERLYSVGIHPWDAAEPFDADALERAVAAPQVVAVGETGLDSLCRVPIERQEELLRHHIHLSEKYGKPLILHVVRRVDRILALRRELRPQMPWIVHGFRGNATTARQLIDHGMYLSLGERFNPQVAATVPHDRLFLETDTSTLPIEKIAAQAGLPLRDFSSFFLPGA